MTPEEFLKHGRAFEYSLQQLKQRIAPADYGWYPYNSLTVLPLLARLFALADFTEDWTGMAAADIGCADGDLAAFLAHLGADVDAVDHRETNFNQMRGAELLTRELALPGRLSCHNVDLDNCFELPRPHYAFGFFLGTLYHLKNPFYVLERLSAAVDCCVVSTRIAAVTPKQNEMEHEGLAYLLGPREANNDPTNYWIFSAAGLIRLLDRTGWIVVAEERIGSRDQRSEPAASNADERMFVLAKSKRLHPELFVRAVAGFHPPDGQEWCWTAKRFSLEVTITRPELPREFALRLVAPDPVLAAGTPVRVTCTIHGQPAGKLTINSSDPLEFRGRFPSGFDSPLRLHFEVESGFEAHGEDRRELGLIVPWDGNRLPFRIS